MGPGPGGSPALQLKHTFLSGVGKAGTGVAQRGASGPLAASLGTLACEDLANVLQSAFGRPGGAAALRLWERREGVGGFSLPGASPLPPALCCVCCSVAPLLSVAIFVMSSSPAPHLCLL